MLCTDIHADAIIDAAKRLLSDEQTSKGRKVLSDLLHNLEGKSEVENRDEDKDWFKGPKTRYFMLIHPDSPCCFFTRFPVDFGSQAQHFLRCRPSIQDKVRLYEGQL